MRRRLAALGLVLAALSTAGCATSGEDGGVGYEQVPEPTVNADPRAGTVEVTDGVWKFCDGATLLYFLYSGGLAAITDSSECQKEAS